MNRREREVMRSQLNAERAMLASLAEHYRKALGDTRREIQRLYDRPGSQSTAYQIEFQSALAEELDRIVRELEEGVYATTEKFVTGSYRRGWNGTFYSIDGQGVNLNIAVPRDVINIVNQTYGSVPLSRRIHSSVQELREQIASELTRGIATGRGWDEISRSLSEVSDMSFRRAQTIGRTEGHRVFQQATYDAQQRAVAAGADVKKQWDSTLDAKVRPSHREAHGQVREVSEPFEVGGVGAPAPGLSGVAREDINCRCVSLQRASWALEDRESASDFDDDSFIDYQISVNS